MSSISESYKEVGQNYAGQKFSYFTAPIRNTLPLCDATLSSVFEWVSSDFFKTQTLQVRDNPALKSQILAYITPSGTFRKRHINELLSYSGIICIDLDKVINIGIKDRLSGDTFLNPALIFVSPSGNGLKLFIRVNNAKKEDHLLYFNAIAEYLAATYQLAVDQSCKDITRACFLCHDPDAWFADGSVESEALLMIVRTPPPPLRAAIPFPDYASFTLPANNQKPSDALNRLPAIHERALRALRSNGWHENGEHFTRLGKELKEGHSAIYNVDPKDGLYKFTNFSINGAPFEVRGYSDVGVICTLEFSGNFDDCIKTLVHEYLPQNTKYPMSSYNQPAIEPADSQESYFQSRSFDKVIADGIKAKPYQKIFGVFLYTNSTTYLFSRTNYGKSLLVFQIAWAAATGKSFYPGAVLQNECEPMKVLVVDLELEAVDLALRHGKALSSMDPEHYKNLVYLHERIEKDVVVGFDLLDKIEKAAIDHQAKLVIIDNISRLLPDALKAETVTMIISSLNRIRKKTGAAILVIGHTTKGNPKVAIQPTDYFGSSMVQNFFTELSYLDRTADNRFFLCHAKTKHAECYDQAVPVFSRGVHATLGFGFTFESLQQLSDVQLPLSLISTNDTRKRNLTLFKNEIALLDQAGVKRTTIASMCNVNPSSITRLFED